MHARTYEQAQVQAPAQPQAQAQAHPHAGTRARVGTRRHALARDGMARYDTQHATRQDAQHDMALYDMTHSLLRLWSSKHAHLQQDIYPATGIATAYTHAQAQT